MSVRADEGREIHNSHDPEPDGQRLYSGGQACRRCGRFVAFEGAFYRVTDAGVAVCAPGREPTWQPDDRVEHTPSGAI